MRIWDISPGYLNRQSLLGEHRELHGLHDILVLGKTGYSRHPETRRWVRARSGLAERHALLAAEMRLRGYVDRTPLGVTGRRAAWPRLFITPPAAQFDLLREKYRGRATGRIPFPRSPQELWAQHKYSVMARSPERYREIGRSVARMRGGALPQLAEELVLALRERPTPARTANAVDHLWGYVRRLASASEVVVARTGPAAALRLVQQLAIRHEQPYLLASTALSELVLYLPPAREPAC